MCMDYIILYYIVFPNKTYQINKFREYFDLGIFSLLIKTEQIHFEKYIFCYPSHRFLCD